MNKISQFIGAICGIKKYIFINIILIWQINVIIYLTNFFFSLEVIASLL